MTWAVRAGVAVSHDVGLEVILEAVSSPSDRDHDGERARGDCRDLAASCYDWSQIVDLHRTSAMGPSTPDGHSVVTVEARAATTELTIAAAHLFEGAAGTVPVGAAVQVDLAPVVLLDRARTGCSVRLDRRLHGGGLPRPARPGRAVCAALELARLHRLLEADPSVDIRSPAMVHPR